MNNNFENPPADQEQANEILSNQEKYEAILESLLLYSEYADEGNNGVIKRIRVKDIPEEILLSLPDDSKIFCEPSMAVKLLKINTEKSAKLEFDMQKQAGEIITQSQKDNPDKKYASIPSAIHHQSLEVKSDELLQILNRDGVSPGPNNKVEIILMDFVEGNDLAKIIYKDVLKCADKKEDLLSKLLLDIRDIDNLSVFDLKNHVNRLLGLCEVRPEDRNNQEKINAVNMENFKQIVAYLKKDRGYKFDESILEKIKNTLDALHEANLFHRDVHERNIIINGDKVSLIDFGSAKQFSGKVDKKDKSIYIENGNKLVSDETLINAYKPLIKTQQEDVQIETNEFYNEIYKMQSRFESNKYWIEYNEKIQNNLNLEELEKALRAVAYGITKSSDSSQAWIILPAAILKFAETNRQLALEYVEKKSQEKNGPFAEKQINNIIRKLKGFT